MSEIDKIHDKFFKKVFSYIANVRSFLKFKLPESLQKHLDLSKIVIDPGSYISGKYKETFSDLVAKCRTKAEDYAVDFYFSTPMILIGKRKAASRCERMFSYSRPFCS